MVEGCPIEEQLLETIREHDLVRPGGHLLVAVSGGADSVALARALASRRDELSISLSLIHLNHKLRGAEADGDALFVERLADELRCACLQESVDVAALAKDQGWSLEMAGRQARYKLFARAAADVERACVATGHTWNDQVETVLMRLCQGSGIGGLCGIPYVFVHDKCRVVRPLRDVKREQILRYLAEKGQAFREDSSNRDPRFLRNRFRHEVVPLLQKVVPSVQEGLVRTSVLAQGEVAWFNEQVDDLFRGSLASQDQRILHAADLRSLSVAVQRHVVRRWLAGHSLAEHGLTFDHVEQVRGLAASVEGTREVHLPGGRKVVRRYQELRIERMDQPEEAQLSEHRVRLPGTTVLEDVNLTVVTIESYGRKEAREGCVGEVPAVAYIQRGNFGEQGLTVRSWRPGDKLFPTGMQGSRKLQDVFVDLKVPRDQRARIPVFACADTVVWVPGYRVDRRWALSGERDPCYEIRLFATPPFLS